MSSTPETPSTPSHWEIPLDTDPLPIELLDGPPRYRCSEDGTRVYSLADIAAHDERFHPKTEMFAGVATADETMLRREALDGALRSASGRGTASQTAAAAEILLAFLRGDTARPGLPAPADAPRALHDALDRAWAVIEEKDGAQVMTDEDDEDVLERLRALTEQDLHRASFVLAIVRVLGASVRAQRSELR